jgi:hypothetical protein
MKTYFVSARFFLKLCAIWVHVSLGVVDRFRKYRINVLVAGKFRS